MTKAEIKVIKKEIKAAMKFELDWCKENKGKSGKSKEYEQGFVKGIKQAELILKHYFTQCF